MVAGTLSGLTLVLHVPYLRDLFHFAPLHADDLLACLGAVVAGLSWFEIYKLLRSRAATSAKS